MNIVADRVGKIAILASISSREEEDKLKGSLAGTPDVKLAVTVVSGIRSEVGKSFVKSVVSSALQANVIRRTSGDIHAVVHAALEAARGLLLDSLAETSVKFKFAVVSDGHWVAVSAYGESAFHPETNHERMGFGVMHI
jgi:hut operon positive regulator